MNCEVIEQKIIELLEGEKLPEEILIHIEKCHSCRDFYNYIVELKNEINKIEKFEPSLNFEEKIIYLILKEPIYLKVFAISLSLFIFLVALFLLYSFKKFLPSFIIFLSKIISLFKIFSSIFEFKIFYVITPIIFTFIITNTILLFILIYLFKKFALKEVKL
ncbi:MAG: hypothetical protein ABIM60_03055 [candidate division WOR-3 bacterium]